MNTYTLKSSKTALGAVGDTVTVDALEAAGVNIEAAVKSGVIEPTPSPKPNKKESD
jgi:hypothetical protein